MLSFLPHQDQVALSGVNKKAYQVLSNDSYFYDLFLKKYCSLEQGEKRLEGQLKHLCFLHPSNCWKVACCVFQASRINFSQQFFDEALPKEVAHLSEEKNRCELRKKKICGDFYEDPSSPIHQIWQTFKEYENLLRDTERLGEASQSLFTQIVIHSGRFNEWNTFCQSLNFQECSSEQIIAALPQFDERLVPIFIFSERCKELTTGMEAAQAIYKQLEKERKLNEDLLGKLDVRLQKLKTTGYSTDDEKVVLFLNPLDQHLANLAASTQSRIDDFYCTFKAWANIASPMSILQGYKQGVMNPSFGAMLLTQTCKDYLFLDAIDHYAEKLGKSIFGDAIVDRYPAESLDDLQQQLNNYTDEIYSVFAQTPRIKIKEVLFDAVEKKYQVKLHSILD